MEATAVYSGNTPEVKVESLETKSFQIHLQGGMNTFINGTIRPFC
jgi:hypothetical protein